MKRTVTVVSTAIFLCAAAAWPVQAQNLKAACAEGLKSAKKEVDNFLGEAPRIQALEGLVKRAQKAQSEGKYRRCNALIARIRERLS